MKISSNQLKDFKTLRETVEDISDENSLKKIKMGQSKSLLITLF